jgi:Tfp pilus assembly protein PilF
MMTSDLIGWSGLRTRAWRTVRLWLLLVPILSASLLAREAAAQISKANLIGDSVSDPTNDRYVGVDEAIKYFGNRDVMGARRLLEKVRELDPALPPVDLLLARLYYLSGNGAAGRASLEKAIMENPDDPEPYIILADQALSQGFTIEADAAYDKAMRLTQSFSANPRRKRNFELRALTGRAIIAERRQNWQAMANDLLALLKIDETNASAHYRLGVAQFMLKQETPGYTSFKTARDKDKNLPHPYVASALMLDRLGKAPEAREAFTRAIQAEPTSLNALANYAQWLIKTNDLNKAEEVLAEARKHHPNALDALILSGVAARMNGKPTIAKDFYLKAIGIAPAHIGVMNQLAQLMIEQSDDEEKNRALQFASINARLNEQSSDAQIALAWVYFKLGKTAELSNALRTGLQLGNLSPDSSYFVAAILAEQSSPDQKDVAKQLLTQALDANAPGIFVNRKQAQALLDKLNGR